MFEQSADRRRKDYCCFTSNFAAQPYAGSIHTGSELLACMHRSLALQTDRTYCIHALVCPPVGNFWRLPYLLIRHRSCRSASAEQSRTPRALRMQLSGCRMTAYRMTAPSARRCCTLSYSNLPISSQDGSDRRNLMENPGLTFKLIITEVLQRSRIHILCKRTVSSVQTPKRKLETIGLFQTGHAAN